MKNNIKNPFYVKFIRLTALSCFFSFIYFLWPQNSFAQSDLVDKSLILDVEGNEINEAKKTAYERALTQITEDYAQEFIGVEKFSKNKSIIQSKVLKQAAKYIPFTKMIVLQSKENIHTIQVDLKFSFANYKLILQEQGLLTQTDALPILIPLIVWQDRERSINYRWWKEGRSEARSESKSETQTEFLVKLERQFENILKSQFIKNGFYVLKPLESSLIHHLPKSFQNEKISQEDLSILGQYFQSSMGLDGLIQIQKLKSEQYLIDVRLTAFLLENNKTVGDISRQYVTENGVYEKVIDKKMKDIFEMAAKDLSSQINEAWQKGTLSSRTLKLSLKSPLTLKDKEDFKEQFKNFSSSIKSIKERVLSTEGTVFEIETPWSAQEFLNHIQSFQFKSKSIKFSALSEAELSAEFVDPRGVQK